MARGERTRSIQFKPTATEAAEEEAAAAARNAARQARRRPEAAAVTWNFRFGLRDDRSVSHVLNLRGLSAAERMLLLIIAGVYPPPSQSELAACLGVQPRQVRALLGSLKTAGLICKNEKRWHTTEAARWRR